MKIVKNTASLKRKDLDNLLNRSDGDLASAETSVKTILKDIQTNGDSALVSYTKKFDCPAPKALKVGNKRIASVSEKL